MRANLASAEGERDRFRGLYEGVGSGASEAQTKAAELSTQLDVEKKLTARTLAQLEVLNQQIAALRRQLAALEGALEASEKKDKDAQTRIADLGQRLNVALAQRVQELSRYRSDFFGRLRAILGNRPDIRIVGDRFVFQSELFFDVGQAVLKPEGRVELDKIAGALLELERQIPGDIAWVMRVDGHTDIRPIASGRSDQLGPVGGARHRGGAVSDQPGHLAAAPGGGGLRRVPAARHRPHRGSLRPQPPHRAEADGAVMTGEPPGLVIRPMQPADLPEALDVWVAAWQAAYPAIDFNARRGWTVGAHR